jgi:trimeric autotransporter adhesin
LKRALLLSAVLLLAACDSDNRGFPADHCTQDCVASDDVLVIEPANSLLLVDGRRQLTATVVSIDGRRRDVTAAAAWRSADSRIATVSTGGDVAAVTPGQTTVTATLPALAAQARVVVSGLTVREVHVSPAYSRILPEFTQQYAAVALLSDGSSVDVTRHVGWSVGDGTIASIDTGGLARGLADGVTDVTARYVRGATDLSDTATLAVRSQAVTIESFFLEPIDSVVLPGARVTYRAIVVTSDNERLDVTADASWLSSDTAVAVVDSTGVATAVAAGNAEVRATLRHRALPYTAAADLRVLAPAPVVTDLRISPQWAEVLVGQQQAYRAEAVLSDHSVVDVTHLVHWQSETPAVAIVSLDGVASAIGPGQTRILATLNRQARSFADSGELRVDAPPPVLESLSVMPIDASVLVDDDLQYRCFARFSDGSLADVTGECVWSVADEAVAVIDAFAGLLTGVGVGATQVQARFFHSGIVGTASTGVEIDAPIGIDTLQVTPASAAAVVFGTQQFRAHTVLTDGRKLDVTANVAWTSADTAIATVGDTGLARGRAPGETQIRAAATYQGIEYADAGQFTVTPSDVTVESMRVLPPLQAVEPGGRARFDAELLLSNGTSVLATDLAYWTALDGNVAQSTQEPGEFEGLQAGATAVRASLNHAGAELAADGQLLVVDPDAITGLEINPPESVLTISAERQLQGFLLLSDGDTIDVTSHGHWTSTDAGVGTVDQAGLLTGVAAGETMIAETVTVGGASLSGDANARVLDPATQLIALRVSPAEASALIGTETRFTATAVYLDGSREDVSSEVAWEVADPAIAELTSQDGLVLAKAEGTTAVSAHYNADGFELADSAELVVKVPVVVVTEIQVTPARRTVASGNRATFTATAVLSDFSHVDVTLMVRWQSSDTSIALASRPPGRFATFRQGQTTISATLSYQTKTYVGQAVLIVTAPEPLSLEVSPPRLRLTVGEQQALHAIVHYTDGSTEDVTREAAWRSQDPSIAAVSSADRKGVVTGTGAGTTRVTAVYRERLSASARVQVVEPVLLSIEIIPATAEVAAGLTRRFTAIGVYDDESSLDITDRARWSSSNEAVAAIVPGEDQGLIEGVTPGTATISAALDGVAGNAAVTVTAPLVVSVDIGPASARIHVGDEQEFVAIARLSDGSARAVTDEVTWTSSNAAVATISNQSGTEGVALGLMTGTTQIQGYYPGVMPQLATLEVVPPPVTAIVVTPTNSSVPEASEVFYTATAFFANSTQLDVTGVVTWASSSPEVASISNAQDKGVATALAAGTTIISATLAGLTGQTGLTVTAACSGRPDSVLIVDDLTVRVGAKAQLAVTGVYPDGCMQDLTHDSATVWKSSDDDVFTVGNKSGLVTGIGVGVATAEAKNRGSTDTATVTVIP